jgi:hypothetical protein
VNPTEVNYTSITDNVHAQMESMTQVMDLVSHVTLNVPLVMMTQVIVKLVPLTETTTQATVLA